MNTTPTTTTRRTFLTRALGALVAAPLLARAAKAEPQYHIGMDPATDHYAEHVVRVEGHAIKVPSNRVRIGCLENSGEHYHAYYGDWDGTFKLERGCTNPAHILADLYERTGAEPDWVMCRHTVRLSLGVYSTHTTMWLLKPHLNWQMLYDWGRACDEVVTDSRGHYRPRFRLAASRLSGIYENREEMFQLRETLRMHYLSWQSTDPRYRTTLPVRGYTTGGLVA